MSDIITDWELQKRCDEAAAEIFEEFKEEHGADFDPADHLDDMRDRAHDEADGWDEGLIEAVLALTGEQTVTEDMIEAESAAPLVCLAGGRPSGRCSEAFADRMLAAVREAPEVDAREQEIFGVDFEPSAAPPLPAWAWR